MNLIFISSLARPLLLCCSLVVALAPASARAEPPPDAPSEAGPPVAEAAKPTEGDDNEVVITGTRAQENRAKSAVRVDVVTAKDAKARGATNVGEAVAGELGVQVNPSAFGAIGSPSAAQVGGFDRERVLVMEDGERVVGDVGGAVDLSQFDLGSVERIEIVQGPASALYGTSAIGGVVNVITGPPQIEGWSGSFRTEGRYRWGGLALGSIAFRQDNSWVVADASFYGSQGVVLVEPDTAIPDLYRIGLSLRAGVKVGRVDSSFRIRYGREASQGVDTQQVPGLGTFFIDLPEVTERFSARLQEKIDLGKGHTLSLSLAKQWFWNQSGNDRRDSPIDDERERFHTMHAAEAIGSFFEGEIVSFLVGGRGEIERFDQNLNRSSLSRGEVVQTSLVEVVPTQLGSGAAYAQVRFDPWEQLSVVAGGRVEGNSRYGVAAAPRLAFAVRPYERLTVRLSGGRGYRAPSAKEIGFVFDHSVYGYRVIGNPGLQPETSWGVQGDVEWRPRKEIVLRASAFSNWVEELIDLRPAASSTIAGVDDYTYVNVGSARTFGAEARVRVRASEWISAEAGYSYLFTRDEELQRPLPGRPPHTVLVSTRVTTPIGLSFVGRARVTTDAYLDDSSRTPPFGSLDLRVGQRTWPGGEVYVGVLNLLGAQKDPNRLGDHRPVEGRTLYLGIGSEFPAEE